MASPQIYMLKPNHVCGSGASFEGEAFGKYLGLDEVMRMGSLWWDSSLYKIRRDQSPVSLSVRTQQNCTVHKPSMPLGPSNASALISDFQSSGPWEVNVYWLSHPAGGVLLWQPELTEAVWWQRMKEAKHRFLKWLGCITGNDVYWFSNLRCLQSVPREQWSWQWPLGKTGTIRQITCSLVTCAGGPLAHLRRSLVWTMTSGEQPEKTLSAGDFMAKPEAQVLRLCLGP